MDSSADRSTKTLVKLPQDGMVAGVCAGLADYFDVDPVLVRAVFVAGTVLSGFSLVLYLVLWIALDVGPVPAEEPTVLDLDQPPAPVPPPVPPPPVPATTDETDRLADTVDEQPADQAVPPADTDVK